MAAKIYAGVDAQGKEISVGREDVYRVPPSSIEVGENLARHDPVPKAEIEALADDIEKNGQISAINCVKTHENRLKVIDGFTRLAACLLIEARNPEFRIKATVAKVNEQEAFLLAVRANHHTHAATSMDNAFNIRKMMDQYGFTKAQVAAFYGKSNAWVLMHENILSMSSKAQAAVRNGSLTVKDAFKMRAMAPEQVEEIVAAVAKPVAPVASLKRAAEAPEPVEALDDPEADDIKAMLNGSRPKARPKAEAAAKPAPKGKGGDAKAKNDLINEAARKTGVQIARQAADLLKLLKGRNDAVSEAVIGYLKGKVDGTFLLEVLDNSEAPEVG